MIQSKKQLEEFVKKCKDNAEEILSRLILTTQKERESGQTLSLEEYNENLEYAEEIFDYYMFVEKVGFNFIDSSNGAISNEKAYYEEYEKYISQKTEEELKKIRKNWTDWFLNLVIADPAISPLRWVFSNLTNNSKIPSYQQGIVFEKSLKTLLVNTVFLIHKESLLNLHEGSLFFNNIDIKNRKSISDNYIPQKIMKSSFQIIKRLLLSIDLNFVEDIDPITLNFDKILENRYGLSLEQYIVLCNAIQELNPLSEKILPDLQVFFSNLLNLQELDYYDDLSLSVMLIAFVPYLTLGIMNLRYQSWTKTKLELILKQNKYVTPVQLKEFLFKEENSFISHDLLNNFVVEFFKKTLNLTIEEVKSNDKEKNIEILENYDNGLN
ncbi:MAG: hypothetical protein ACRC4M_04065 [Mycoplasma sp.]